MAVRSRVQVVGCEEGAALLEFAVIFPILMALSIGCVEVGRLLFTYSVVENSLRGGARYLAQVPDASCTPTCSWGAMRAIELTRTQIVSNTGIRSTAVRVWPQPGATSDTIVLEAEVDVDLIFSSLFKPIAFWTVKVSRREQKIAG